MNSLESYRLFAPVYRAFVQQRGHFERQAALLAGFFRANHIPSSAKILDASCGTGDVVGDLITRGWVDCIGLDGAPDMLAQSPLHVRGRVFSCRWEELDNFFRTHGEFDVIFMLGHALPHATKEALPSILNSVRRGLRADGVFLCDIRDWDRTEAGLREIKRPEGQWRDLPVQVPMISGRERITYTEERQLVDYEFRVEGVPDIITIELSYALFTKEEFVNKLINVGFTGERIVVRNVPEWSYVLIEAHK